MKLKSTWVGEKLKRKKTTLELPEEVKRKKTTLELPEEVKRKKTTTTLELPEELIREEILRRLPIKSVVRFKSVSKSWLSLLSSPQFVKQHKATQNPNDCLIAKEHTKIVLVSRLKETVLQLSNRYYQLVGSVNGLVCLRWYYKLSLWNPAIHQSKEFTFPPNRNRDLYYYEYHIGFGFDPVSNDYKVVVLSHDFRSAAVYYSSSDSWIDILIPDDVFSKNRTLRLITVVKDCPYWIFHRYLHADMNTLSCIAVKFNVGSNEFKLLPEFCYDTSLRGARCNYKVLDMNDRLSLMVHDQNSSNFMVDIYSLEEGCCVWRKMSSVGPLNFLMQDSYYSLSSQGFKYGGEILLNNGRMFFCYDDKTHTFKRLGGTTDFSSGNCFRYTPSLVFLQGMNSVHLRAAPVIGAKALIQ